MSANESRPTVHEAASKVLADYSKDTGPSDIAGGQHAPADAAFADAFAVVVYGRATRRRIYLNLPSAESAVRRAHDRGDDASMTLVRLVPSTQPSGAA